MKTGAGSAVGARETS